MFGIVVAIVSLAVTGWYFWRMLKPLFRNSENHSACSHCQQCTNCPISRQSFCDVFHEIETSHEITNQPNTNSEQHDQ
ncbi:MAG: hypothetical protein LBC20_11250 [Planctomycetaceae bacterium]|nr:hypothetical protein [Planctomycetaceae bacterium]